MTHYTTLFQQLPQRLQVEISAHLGSTAGMSEVQIATRYKDVAWWLRSVKLATLPPGYAPHSGHLTAQEFNGLGAPVGVAPELAEILNQFIAYESSWHLDNFVHQLLAVITQLHEAARQQAQREAEQAARQLAQRQAEEAARQLAQRQAEEAARLAARQLAEQQAHASAQALAQQKAQEAALQEARRALEIMSAVPVKPAGAPAQTASTSVETASRGRAAQAISFVPGPAAMAEIDRATLVLKQGIEAALTQYALAIAPYLNNLKLLRTLLIECARGESKPMRNADRGSAFSARGTLPDAGNQYRPSTQFQGYRLRDTDLAVVPQNLNALRQRAEMVWRGPPGSNVIDSCSQEDRSETQASRYTFRPCSYSNMSDRLNLEL